MDPYIEITTRRLDEVEFRAMNRWLNDILPDIHRKRRAWVDQTDTDRRDPTAKVWHAEIEFSPDRPDLIALFKLTYG